MSYPEIRESLVPILHLCEVAAITLETHLRGLEMAERYGFSVWDGLIVASAIMAGCSVLYTEEWSSWHAWRYRNRIKGTASESASYRTRYAARC